MMVTAQRFASNPLITPASCSSIGANINGPSAVRVPHWLKNALGRYYLYFADHHGTYIRLAYADQVTGPWRIHQPGTLQLAQTPFPIHIASPDVHCDDANRRLVMYYHGYGAFRPGMKWDQHTCVAFSQDGLQWESQTEPLCQSYFRRFTWRGQYYGIAMPGELYRSADGVTGFEAGPILVGGLARHFAVLVRGDTLHIFYSRKRDCPECILRTTVPLTADWHNWRASEPVVLLQPDHDYEGADRPLTPSRGGSASGRVNEVRDPAVLIDGQLTYLFYTIAGESGIAGAETQL